MSPVSNERPEVWFLTGSQAMYGPETLDQVAAAVPGHRRAGWATDRTPRLRVVWKPVLLDAASIHRQMLEANSAPWCVGVIAWMHTFSPAKMWIGGLDALRKPLLHLHTQAGMALPWSTIDMDFMNLNQAAHGDREFGLRPVAARRRAQDRRGTRRLTGRSSPASPRGREPRWAAPSCRTLRLARFGDNMRDVAVTEGDKVEAQIRFGVSVNTYGVNDLVAVVDQVGDERHRHAGHRVRRHLPGRARAASGGERHDSLRYGARIELGLRAFLDEGGFGAFTTNFEDLGGLRQLPGLAVQRLMADGYGFGGEGDWKTSALLRGMKAMAHGLPGGTSFMEDYTYHLVPGEEKVLGAHMLEVCPSITSARPSLEIHPLTIGGREDPVRLRFTADPGAGVVVGLSDVGDRFRLTVNEIDLVEPDEELPNLPVACAVWKPRPSLSTSAEGWLMAGASHHTVLSSAVGVEVLADFAEMTRTELVVIDAETTPRSISRELRWNAAYYRLAQGL